MTATEEVLVPVSGIVDAADNHGFVRTSGYLPGPDDVYVSVAQLKRYGLRRGDLVTGTAREGEARQGSAHRDRHNPITRNNPECHLMVVLVDERPEEVTDMQRSVKGEVIASTFDRPPSDHTTVAELSIERAKRLVELGQDVVVLLDSITRLGRAYNNASPASGRILAGGIDAAALYPPKRILGTARNLEEGGSLTVIATAMVETGSTGDTVLFEEYKSTGNAELKLDRRTAEKRVFPAIDIDPSGTRKEEILLAPDELAVIRQLRKALQTQGGTAAVEQLLDGLRKTTSNAEFLIQLSRSMS
jgi:transcription termination factor Rho